MGESNFCEVCMPEVEKLIEYVRQLENGQVVAKEALDTLVWANEKLQEQVKNLRSKTDDTEKDNIEAKMQELHNAELRMLNRGKLGVE